MAGNPKVVVLHEDRQLFDQVAELAKARGCDVVALATAEELEAHPEAIVVVVDETRARRDCETLLEALSKFEGEPGVVVVGAGRLGVAIGRSRADIFPVLTGPLREASLSRVLNM